MVLINKFHLRRCYCYNGGNVIWQYYYYLYVVLVVVGYLSNIVMTSTTISNNNPFSFCSKDNHNHYHYSSILVTAYIIHTSNNKNNNQYQNYYRFTNYVINEKCVHTKQLSTVRINKNTCATILAQRRSNRNSLFQEEENDYTGYYFDEDDNDYYEDRTKVTSEQRRRGIRKPRKEIPVLKDQFFNINDEFDDDYDTTDRNSINNNDNNNDNNNEEYNINIQQRQQQKRKLQSSSAAQQQQQQQLQKQQQRQFREPTTKTTNIVDEWRIINRSTNDVTSSLIPISSSSQQKRDNSSRGAQGQARQQNSRRIEHDYELDDDDDDDNYDIDDDDDVDDMYYDDNNDDDDDYNRSKQNSVSSPSTGNFWSNPVGTVDDNNILIRPKKQRTQNRDQTPSFSIASASSILPFMNNNNDNNQNNRRRQQSQSQPQPTQTTFRSGLLAPRPPNPVLELYNNLFWYGFDPTDTISPSDPTMFGGTKGKFNGLSYLYDGEATLPDEYRRTRRTRPRQKQQQQQVKYDDDDDEYYDATDDIDDDEFVDQNIERSGTTKRKIQPVVTPPYDPPLPVVMSMRNKEVNGSGRRIPRQSSDSNKRRPSYDEEFDADNNYDDEYNTNNIPSSRRRRDNTDDNGDWVVNEVSNWFRTDKVDTRNTDSRNKRKEVQVDGRRKRSIALDDDNSNNENDDPWQTISYAFDAFLGINRDQLKRKAVKYDNQMGISTSSTTPVQRKRRQRPPPQPQRLDNDENDNRQRSTTRRQQRDDSTNRIRPGFTYRYDDVNDDDNDDESKDSSNIIDADPILVEDDEANVLDQTTSSTRRDRQTTRKREEKEDQDIDSTKNHRANDEKMTWEQRALAMERVPPGNVPAWGPTGDLGIDARTKGLSDALEDIADAKYTIEQHQKKIIQYKEEMTILRVDNQLERKRLGRYVSSINDNSNDNNNNIDPVLYESNIEQMNEQIRRIDQQIETISRSLRYEKMKLQSAKDELDDIETRHWALLRYYNPNLAKETVDDALRELEQVEPAVRSIRDRSISKMIDDE